MPKFINLEIAIYIHDVLIQKDGGSLGLRDPALLESALAQPESSFGGNLLHPTKESQAAAYLFHICKNHPFIDGNKRTALGVMDTFVILNGWQLTLNDDQLEQLVLDTATSVITKEQLTAILKPNAHFFLLFAYDEN